MWLRGVDKFGCYLLYGYLYVVFVYDFLGEVVRVIG